MVGGLIRGAVAGAVGTWLMDLATTGMYAGQSEETTRQEEAARPNGRGSVANFVARAEAATGLELTDGQRATAGQAMHYALGVVPGALYGALHERLPLPGRGVLYGLLLFAVNDEYVNTRLGLAGPFGAYPLATHARGLVGHLVLGMTTDTIVELLGG